MDWQATIAYFQTVGLNHMARKKIHTTAADKLRYFTDRSNAIHRKYLDDPLFFDQYEQFLAWQIDYMLPFYEDFRTSDELAAAVDFVISDLTGVGISKRDEDLARVLPVMSRMLPDAALVAVATAMEINARILEINVGICRELYRAQKPDRNKSERDYCLACRRTSELGEFLELISLLTQVGESLDRVIHIPMIGVTMSRRAGCSRARSCSGERRETWRCRPPALPHAPVFRSPLLPTPC